MKGENWFFIYWILINSHLKVIELFKWKELSYIIFFIFINYYINFQGKKNHGERSFINSKTGTLNLNIKRMTRRNTIDELLKHWNNLMETSDFIISETFTELLINIDMRSFATRTSDPDDATNFKATEWSLNRISACFTLLDVD